MWEQGDGIIGECENRGNPSKTTGDSDHVFLLKTLSLEHKTSSMFWCCVQMIESDRLGIHDTGKFSYHGLIATRQYLCLKGIFILNMILLLVNTSSFGFLMAILLPGHPHPHILWVIVSSLVPRAWKNLNLSLPYHKHLSDFACPGRVLFTFLLFSWQTTYQGPHLLSEWE